MIEENENKNIPEKEEEKNIVIDKLPSWSIEPPIEIKRGEQ